MHRRREKKVALPPGLHEGTKPAELYRWTALYGTDGVVDGTPETLAQIGNELGMTPNNVRRDYRKLAKLKLVSIKPGLKRGPGKRYALKSNEFTGRRIQRGVTMAREGFSDKDWSKVDEACALLTTAVEAM